MKAEILSIGTELLLGEVADTNSSYLASWLPLLGLELHHISVVGDDLPRMVETLQEAVSRSDIIFTTGGLGPTEDDLTREAIAKLLGEELRVSPEILDGIRAMFASIGRDMPPGNIKQATLIASARTIPNPRGTAPGWWVEKNGKTIVTMPGPPGEMERMWQVEVMPELQRRLHGDVLRLRTLKCFGLSEAEVDGLVSPLFVTGNGMVGIYARMDGIHVRIIARAHEEQEAQTIITHGEKRVREVLGDRLWGTDDERLEAQVGQLLQAHGLTLATMESCTGGLLGSTLTDVPGSSAYYRGGFIAYSNEVKMSLGVDAEVLSGHGAVSGETAAAMAEVARLRLSADIGVGITGVAGPDSQEGKPPGLAYIGIADRVGSQYFEGRYPPRRDEVKRRAVTHALFLLRQRLVGADADTV